MVTPRNRYGICGGNTHKIFIDCNLSSIKVDSYDLKIVLVSYSVFHKSSFHSVVLNICSRENYFKEKIGQ